MRSSFYTSLLTRVVLAAFAVSLVALTQCNSPDEGGVGTPVDVIALSDDDTTSCPDFMPPPSHTDLQREDDCEALHAPGKEDPFMNSCTTCHGQYLMGGAGPSCYTCHGPEWDSCPDFMPPPSHTILEREDDCEAWHAPGYEYPFANSCTTCHGQDLMGGAGPSCFTCHGQEWDEGDDDDDDDRDDDDDDDDEYEEDDDEEDDDD